MAKPTEILKGADKTLTATLMLDGKPLDVTGWTITAAIKDRSVIDTTLNGATISCADSGGADFSAGIIEVIYTDVQTAALTAGLFELEVNGVDGSSDVEKWISEQTIKVVDTGI